MIDLNNIIYVIISGYHINTLTTELNFKKELLFLKNTQIVKSLKKVDYLSSKVDALRSIKVTASGYTAVKKECDSDPTRTAIMRKATPGRTVAVSRDLKHLLGKRVYIKNLGVRVIEDLMSTSKKKSIDILFHNRKTALSFGKRNLNIVVID